MFFRAIPSPLGLSLSLNRVARHSVFQSMFEFAHPIEGACSNIESTGPVSGALI